MKTKKSCHSGLIAWLENTRITLPLKGVEAHFDVRGDLVSVRLRQVYFQSHTAPLQVRYTFPLPGGASVYRCTILVNDRVISARILPLEEARKQAAEKKAAGHRTALVESVRENLFELELGNLAPGGTVVVELAWFQIMESSGQERSFRIPFTPGIRYIPGAPLLRQNTGRGTEDDTSAVPDASRLSPPRVDAFHPDAAWASVEGCIAADGTQVDAASPSHTLVLRDAPEGTRIRLGDAAAIPDRDFVLRIQPRAGETLTRRAWVTQEQEHASHWSASARPAIAQSVSPRPMSIFSWTAQALWPGTNGPPPAALFAGFLRCCRPMTARGSRSLTPRFSTSRRSRCHPRLSSKNRRCSRSKIWRLMAGPNSSPHLSMCSAPSPAARRKGAQSSCSSLTAMSGMNPRFSPSCSSIPRCRFTASASTTP